MHQWCHLEIRTKLLTKYEQQLKNKKNLEMEIFHKKWGVNVKKSVVKEIKIKINGYPISSIQ